MQSAVPFKVPLAVRARGLVARGAGGCLEKTAPVQVHAPARAASTRCAFFCTQKLLGFELDADDIKDIEKTLRVKYCGQSGLYGAC